MILTIQLLMGAQHSDTLHVQHSIRRASKHLRQEIPPSICDSLRRAWVFVLRYSAEPFTPNGPSYPMFKLPDTHDNDHEHLHKEPAVHSSRPYDSFRIDDSTPPLSLTSKLWQVGLLP